MNQLPCLKQVALWLSLQRRRVNREAVRRQFTMSDEDLNALLHYLQHRELIKDVACIGETEIVQSFVTAASTRRLATHHSHCPGYGDKPVAPLSRDRVFIVHGRNINALNAIQEFLRSLHLTSITFRDAIRLTSKQNRHIDEIITAGMANSYATLVLFTGDEEARLKPRFRFQGENKSETELQSQPRPNVIFEAGMALAQNPDRTILVQYGSQLRAFSDLAGVFVLPIRDTLEDRRTLKEQLEKAGCQVNPKGGKWRTAGRFPSPSGKSQQDGG